MKKLADKLLSLTADLALGAMVSASGLASVAGTYQPKEPKDFKRVVEQHGKC